MRAGLETRCSFRGGTLLLTRWLGSVPVSALLAAAALACNGEDLSGPVTGTLNITTSTVGVEPDSLGYTIQVDGGSPLPIAPSTALWFPGLTSGEHTVSLGDVASNCSVDGENPRPLSVSASDTTFVAFSVSCRTTRGGVRVYALTTGAFPDANGYVITVDGVDLKSIGPHNQSILEGLPPGRHVVALRDVAANCRVEGLHPRIVQVTVGSTETVGFLVDCSEPPPIAFVAWGGEDRPVINLVNPDGSGLVTLSHEPLEVYPEWSRDRSKIAFDQNADLYVMNSDGTGRTRLTTDLWFLPGRFRWSPDGRSVAGAAQDCPKYSVGDCPTVSIWIVRVDGSGATRLVEGDVPSWSPDGRTIAFSPNSGGIYTVNSDGRDVTGLAPLTSGFGPVWSPDGTRITFQKKSNAGLTDIWVMTRDGTGLLNLTAGRGNDVYPAWSPDGSTIAFSTNSYGHPDVQNGIGLLKADGSSRLMITATLANDGSPAWSPDGRRLAFVRDGFGTWGYSDICVVDAAGGVVTNVSNTSSEYESDPVWSSR